MNITWTEETRKLSDLKPYENNPRYITKASYQRLLKSIQECGYNNRMLINKDNTIVGGHARLQALKEMGYTEIKVLVPNRLLTHEEFQRILITDNLDFGDFDTEILANHYDIELLLDWGLRPELLEGPKVLDMAEMNELISKDSTRCEQCPFKEEKKSFDLSDGN